MNLDKQNLTKLKPIKFPTDKQGSQPIPVKSGKSTREVIAEMKRLSKKDIFVTD